MSTTRLIWKLFPIIYTTPVIPKMASRSQVEKRLKSIFQLPGRVFHILTCCIFQSYRSHHGEHDGMCLIDTALIHSEIIASKGKVPGCVYLWRTHCYFWNYSLLWCSMVSSITWIQQRNISLLHTSRKTLPGNFSFFRIFHFREKNDINFFIKSLTKPHFLMKDF